MLLFGYVCLVLANIFEVIYKTQRRVFHQISKDCGIVFFLTNFELFGLLMKHSFECPI